MMPAGRVRHMGKGRRGSASALIVMLLVLLVFFGVLSLVTAAADNRLAMRRAEWVRSYYTADQAAVVVLGDLSQYVSDTTDEIDAVSLKEKLESRLAGQPSVEILRSEADGTTVRLLLRIHAGEQAIEAGADFQLTDPASGAVVMTVTQWTYWQEPFDYDNTSGGIWKG